MRVRERRGRVRVRERRRGRGREGERERMSYSFQLPSCPANCGDSDVTLNQRKCGDNYNVTDHLSFPFPYYLPPPQASRGTSIYLLAMTNTFRTTQGHALSCLANRMAEGGSRRALPLHTSQGRQLQCTR